jgi:hypothetical protein
MRRILFIAAAGGIIFGLTGCASIMSGTSQDLTFNSNPDDATVTVGGRVIGKTPITTRLTRESGQTLTFSRDGYKPITMRLETTLNGWFWGNVLLGGFFGSTTDGMSGALHEYSPSQYMVTLAQEGATALEEKPSLSNRQKTKEFVVVSYRELVKDLQMGKGPYLASLLDLLAVKPEEKPATITKLKALVTAYPDIPEFADRVTDLSKASAESAWPYAVPQDGSAVPTSTSLSSSATSYFNCPFNVKIGQNVEVKLKSGKSAKGTLQTCTDHVVIRSGVFRYDYPVDDIAALTAK